jgi:lysophospholipase L1-like esterase
MSSPVVTPRSVALGMGCILLLAAVVLEGGVRLIQRYRYGDSASVYRFQIDPVTGLKRMVAGATRGSRVSIHINSRGFRGPELERPKPAARIRLAFIGGSTTFCAEVSGDEFTWPHLVWQSLRAEFPAAGLDYVNAGVPGYSSEQSLQSLKYYIAPLQPDVILIYEATNDLSLDARRLAEAQGIYRHKNQDASSFAQWSVAWQLIEKNLKILAKQKEATAEAQPVLRFDPERLSRSFEQRLTQLVEESRRVAPVVALATFSYKVRRDQTRERQLQAANTALFYMPYMDVEGLLAGYEEYNRVIRAVAKKTGALLIDGELTIPGDDRHFYDSVHFTDEGSRAMARRIGAALAAEPRFKAFMVSRMQIRSPDDPSRAPAH